MVQPATYTSKRAHVDMRLGTFLVRIGLVSEADIVQDLITASAVGLPLGKILVARQRITPDLLKLVIDAQWLIVDGAVDEKTARKAMQLAARNGWRLADALVALGSDNFPQQPTRLGDLLLSTHLIDEDELARELEIAKLSGLPLGRVLIAHHHLSEELVQEAIKLQHSVRDETINFEQASEKLLQLYAESEKKLESNSQNADEKQTHHKDVAGRQQKLTFYDFLFLISYLNRDRLKEVVKYLGADDDLLYGVLGRKATGDRKFDVKAALRNSAVLTQLLAVLYPNDAKLIYCARAAYLAFEEGNLSAEEALVRYFDISGAQPPQKKG
jgi:hypothetical protein